MQFTSPYDVEKCHEQLHFALLGSPTVAGSMNPTGAKLREKNRQANDINVDLHVTFAQRAWTSEVICRPRVSPWAMLFTVFWLSVLVFVTWNRIAEVVRYGEYWFDALDIVWAPTIAVAGLAYAYVRVTRQTRRLVDFVAAATKAEFASLHRQRMGSARI